MTLKLNKIALAAMVVCVTLTACSSDDDDDNSVDVVIDETNDFAFSETEFDAYTRVDRSGMPAIATALIMDDNGYNAADPIDDAASDNPYVAEIIGSLSFLHGALDDDLQAAGLVPCTVVGDGTGTCVAAAKDLILPDVMTINTAELAAFPNGRLLTDPVVDVTLALALLELTDDSGQTVTSLVGQLNPTANDVEFSGDFPYLADPN